jgi:hypothetical protein
VECDRPVGDRAEPFPVIASALGTLILKRATAADMTESVASSVCGTL